MQNNSDNIKPADDKNRFRLGSDLDASSRNHKLFAFRLKKRREKLNFTQKEVADYAGVAKNTYQTWEGETVPNSKYIPLLAEKLKCSTDWLLSGKGPAPDDGPIYKVEEQPPRQVATPEAGYDPHGGWQPKLQDEDHRLIGQVYEMLKTDSIYRQALVSNIRAFSAAAAAGAELAQTIEQLAALAVENKELKARVEAIEQKLSVPGPAELKKSEVM